MQKVKRFFADFDLFAAIPTLRAKEQKQSSSLFSGVVSFLLTLFFAYVFINSSVNIFTYGSIQSVQTQSKLAGSAIKVENLFFAIRVGYLPASQSMKYFDIGYYVITQDGQNITGRLGVCTSDQWTKIGDDYLQQFQEYKIGQFFCPLPGADSINLYKVYYAQNSQYAVVFIRPCIGYSYCENMTAQKQFVQNLTDEEGAIFLLSYFLDTVIDPQSQTPVKYTINTDVELAFTTLRGIIATVQFGSFQIQTDVSFSPLVQTVIQKGNFVNGFRETSIQLKNFDDNYALIYLQTNRKYILLQRVVGKLDEMLSYAGGLFSILISFLALFIRSFNIYRYQLMVAEGVFHETDEGTRIREDDFTIWKYLKYVIFDWIQTLFCIRVKWQDCIQVDQIREEANCHLDVTKLFRKMQSMESCLHHLVEQEEKDCLALVKPDSFGKIRRNRLILQYYEAIVQGKQALTIQSYIISKKFLNFGLWLARQTKDQYFENSVSSNNKIENEHIFEDKSQSLDVETQQRSQLLINALKYFKQIDAQAEKIKLSEQLMQIQKQLAQEFINLRYEARLKIQQRIPIIILQRLKRHVQFEEVLLKKPPHNQKLQQEQKQKDKDKPSSLEFQFIN